MTPKRLSKDELELKTAESVERLIRPEIKGMHAYPVANGSGLLKLDAMESPYVWAPDLKKAWLEALSRAEINRYPEPDAPGLAKQLRATMNIGDHHGLLFGNGSDELIQLLATVVAAPGRTLMTPDPGFVMFEVVASMMQLEFASLSLDKQFDIDIDTALAEIKDHSPSLIFLPRPNNPTGNVFSEAKVRRIIENTNALVVIDEAYSAFTDSEALHLLDEYPNVLVMRTLSKVGLAGLRLGVLIGAPRWLNEIDKARLPYNINVLTQISVEFALRHYDVLRKQSSEIKRNRQRLYEQLQAVSSITVWPSEANFLLFRCEERSAADIVSALRDAGILIKSMHGKHPSLSQCLRVTIVEQENNDKFFSVLLDILGHGH